MDARSLDLRRGGRHRWRRPIRPAAGRRVARGDPPRPGRGRSWSSRSCCSSWPGSSLVAGIEATDPTTPVIARPGRRGRVDGDSGNRTYATMHGALLVHVRRDFEDDNGNGIEDEGERRIVWYYWLVDRDARAGVTVRSTRPPEVALHVSRDRGSSSTNRAIRRGGLRGIRRRSESCRPHDRTGRSSSTPPTRVGGARTLDLAWTPRCPRTGTSVELTGARLGVVRRGLLARRRTATRCATSTSSDLFEFARLRPGLAARHPRAGSRLPGVHRGGHDDRAPPSRGACRRRREARRAASTSTPSTSTSRIGTSSTRQAAAGSAPLAFALAAALAGAGRDRSSSASPAAT